MSAFYYGYVVSQIPGGYMAEFFGPKIVYGMAIFLSGIFSLLTPVVARWNVHCLIALRVLMGLVQVSIFFNSLKPNYNVIKVENKYVMV